MKTTKKTAADYRNDRKKVMAAIKATYANKSLGIMSVISKVDRLERKLARIDRMIKDRA